jgi:hypothetical protein
MRSLRLCRVPISTSRRRAGLAGSPSWSNRLQKPAVFRAICWPSLPIAISGGSATPNVGLLFFFYFARRRVVGIDAEVVR